MIQIVSAKAYAEERNILQCQQIYFFKKKVQNYKSHDSQELAWSMGHKIPGENGFANPGTFFILQY